jgi:cytochrome P450
MCIAFLVNTTPAMFWLLFFIYSDSELLADVRKEIEAIIEVTTDSNASINRLLDITQVKKGCPLLASTFQETLRYTGMINSIRQMMEDTMLDGKWLLKKDALIQMPARVLHMDTSIWGADAEDFKPRRFIQAENGKKPSTSGFRAFGGGASLCPGRHFATTEILSLVSMFVMRFDLEPVKGEWTMPSTNNTNVAAAIMKPGQDIEVEVSLRKGFEDGKWRFCLTESKEIFVVADEDRLA